MPVTIGAKRESDFTDPLGMLSDCHRRVERFLQVLIDVTRQAQGAELSAEQQAALETGLLYFREAAPKHTADEEESLFPRLRATGREDVAKLMRSIDVLEADHGIAAEAHREVERLGGQWLRERKLAGPDVARLSTQLTSLAELYRRHIQIEDNEVFPAAHAILSVEDRKVIGEEMAARREIGPRQP